MFSTVYLVFFLFFIRDVVESAYLPSTVEVIYADNDTPIIGVLSEEILYSFDNLYPGVYKSYIAASYVKFVEGGGGRVIPIWIDKERSYYEDIMTKINGVLFPGGSVWFNISNGYSDAARHIYDIAKTMNDDGNYFPLWGTCLGFELLTYLSADGREHRAVCSSSKQSLPLEFKSDFRTSKMFSEASDEIVQILSKESVTSNFHNFCVTEKNLTDFNIADQWKVLSLNKDVNGFEFISSMESTKYPFYGVQFHPEKNIYEWVPERNISHTKNALKANSYFGEFFIDEARKSLQKFGDRSEEQNYLIYNFAPTYTGKNGSLFEQSYLFTI